jgi:hypothetical protein
MFTVAARMFAQYEEQARSVLTTMEAGDKPDLTTVSNNLGTDVEWLLCDLFRLDEATAKYWVDGVMIDAARLESSRILVLTGRAWCADHREQWQVRSEVPCRFSGGQEPILESLTIRVGNAAVGTLADHRSRSITKTANLREWLISFDVYSYELTNYAL